MEASEAAATEATEQHPAPDQSPVATAAAKAIVGAHGLDQQPVSSLAGDLAANLPHATSAPPPETQGGVPLAADIEAGVQPGEPGTQHPYQTEEEAKAEAGEVNEAEQNLDPASPEAQAAENHVSPATQGTVT